MLFAPVLVTHPHMIELIGMGSAGKSPADYPSIFDWLQSNVPWEGWHYGTHFGSLFVFFSDKEKAALFKTFFV